MSYKDQEKRRATQRRWRERNKERLRAYYNEKFGADYKRKWREVTPGQRKAERAARKVYYEANKDEERRKAREYMRAYHVSHREEARERAKKNYEKGRAWFKAFLGTLSCVRCGESDSDCLEFHHREPKGSVNGRRVDAPIASLVMRSEAYIRREASRCDVLCANCHRREHARLRRLLKE
jgi:hypothetical protein